MGFNITTRERTTFWRHWLAFHKIRDVAFNPIPPTVPYKTMVKAKLAFNAVRLCPWFLVTKIRLRGDDFIMLLNAWFIGTLSTHIGAGPFQYHWPLTVDYLTELISHTDLTGYKSK